MRRTKILAGASLCLVVIGLAGCNSRVRYETTFKLDGGRDRTLEIDAPKYDQNVNIEVVASDPVKVEVTVLEAKKGKMIKMKTDVKSFSEVVAVPAGQRFAITVSPTSQKSTEVTVKARSID